MVLIVFTHIKYLLVGFSSFYQITLTGESEWTFLLNYNLLCDNLVLRAGKSRIEPSLENAVSEVRLRSYFWYIIVMNEPLIVLL